MSYIKMADENVVAVHLGDEGKNTFYHITDGWVDNHSAAWLHTKETLFDMLCKEPNIDDIEGRIVYLNPTELQELLAG